jgi:purine-binding chemotaxis protein CheW
MNTLTSLVVFVLDGQRYALELRRVDRIVPAVEVTRLPGVPKVVSGVIDLAGTVVPVVSLRERLGMADREVHPADQLVIARTTTRMVALMVDESVGVIERPTAEVEEMTGMVAGLAHIHGAARTEDGLVWIHDLDRFLSLEEAKALDEALVKHAAHGAEC